VRLDEIVPAQIQALPDARDSVAKLKVRQQDAEPQARLLKDVLPQARFPVQLQVAAARQVAAQTEQAQLRGVRAWLKLEPPVRVQQASQPQALRRSDESESSDELPSCQQAQRGAQRLEPQRGQLRERAPQYPAWQQASPEQQAPRQSLVSRPQPQAQQEPRQASPLAFWRPWPSRPSPPPQLLQRPPDRGNACAPVPRASGQSSSSASFFP
jgi:hypothetical protein